MANAICTITHHLVVLRLPGREGQATKNTRYWRRSARRDLAYEALFPKPMNTFDSLMA